MDRAAGLAQCRGHRRGHHHLPLVPGRHALEDGPTDWGSEVFGAFSETLRIDTVAEEDAADYHVEATNSCGTTRSDVARITVRLTPDLPTEWTVTVLHPAWATEGSVVYGVEGGQQVGAGSKMIPLYDTMYQISRPVIWSGTASSAVDVTPGTSVGGSINATNGDTQAGWWWWPYSCRVGGEWTTCYSRPGREMARHRGLAREPAGQRLGIQRGLGRGRHTHRRQHHQRRRQR